MIGRLYRRVRYSLVAKNILHSLAMNAPHDLVRNPLYRMRGSIIGRNVAIGAGAFLEEARPNLITIKDNAQIGPKTILVTHDSSKTPTEYGRIVVGERAYIGAGAILLPGVSVGDGAVVGAGAVVTKDVPHYVVVAGVPAKELYPVSCGDWTPERAWI